ncbi:MAG TPA: hypothetical protein VFS67_16100 [Polyangiaceae bacterium]|jgi:hypothetical protein|nr:hypothetical protein [Polyangiaceae bacterium]
MHAIDAQAVPEQLIAELNRRRHWKMFGAIAGIVVALAALFAATMAMYSDKPGSSLQPPPASIAER